jgi:hypothetical protein
MKDTATEASAPDARSALAGRGLVRAAWWSNLPFAATALPFALGIEAMEIQSIVVALLLFVVAIGAFLDALVRGAARTTRGDDVAVANLFFLSGSAPRRVRLHFLGAFVLSFAIAAVAAAWEPFVVLVPMLPLGLAGAWAARHGRFPPRAMRGRPR